jgi:hypothetical protein
MKNFEERLKDFLIGQEIVENLWLKSVEEAREEMEDDWDLFETAKNIFQDLLIEHTYDWIVENIQEEIAKEFLTEAVNDTDFENIINAIITEKHLWEEV